MGFLNKVMLLGNVTRNPEVRFIPGRDIPVAKFGLGINRRTKDKEDTCFIDIVAFGKTAEVCGEYVTKGMPLLIEGRLQYSTWEADGQKRSKHEVLAIQRLLRLISALFLLMLVYNVLNILAVVRCLLS